MVFAMVSVLTALAPRKARICIAKRIAFLLFDAGGERGQSLDRR